MSTLSDHVRDTTSRPKWPTVDEVGDLHSDRFVHDAVRTIPAAVVTQCLRASVPIKTRLSVEMQYVVWSLWPCYLLAAHQVMVLKLLYPPNANLRAWEGDLSATIIDLSRQTEAEGLYVRKWGNPWAQYTANLRAFIDWSR